MSAPDFILGMKDNAKTGQSRPCAAMSTLGGWKKRAGVMPSKKLLFSRFQCGFCWMSRVAMMAEKLDHHPEWSNVYKTVKVTLTTHDAGGLSDLDVKMARFMDKTAGAAGRPNPRETLTRAAWHSPGAISSFSPCWPVWQAASR